MDYSHITLFFEKFKNIIFQKEQIKEIVIKIISETISYPIENNFIEIKKGQVFIKSSPLLKNEILIHKKEIFDRFKKELPEGFNLTDIK